MDAGQEKEIKELRQLVEKDLAINADTNKMMRQMRRGARWSLFFQILYWLVILGVIGASYYYVSPYVGSVYNVFQGIERYLPSQTHTNAK
ncbi:MAG: hypothetical protein ACREGH_01325 [Minisyncoccia bacterium]